MKDVKIWAGNIVNIGRAVFSKKVHIKSITINFIGYTFFASTDAQIRVLIDNYAVFDNSALLLNGIFTSTAQIFLLQNSFLRCEKSIIIENLNNLNTINYVVEYYEDE
jgi:hypothetical protein